MITVILAGGFGTRISEETIAKPKPMVEIGGRPILWHIMKFYSSYGFNEFIICCGYKGFLIKDYFANYYLHNSDVSFDFKDNKIDIINKKSEPWKITLIDTGANTQTGGRLKRIAPYLKDEPFFFTYGDGLSDVDINMLRQFHLSHKKDATVTTVQPKGRFGAIKFDYQGKITAFKEKPKGDEGWINGGFFVLNPNVINRIKSDETIWESEPLESLVSDNNLMAYKHTGFWQPMDTLRDKNYLEYLWNQGNPSWKKWE